MMFPRFCEICRSSLRRWTSFWLVALSLNLSPICSQPVQSRWSSSLIAEVLKRLERMSPEIHARVDRIRDIAGMRNTIVHDYDEVDLEIVHDAATFDVPLLKQQIDAWAAELGMEPPPE